MSTSIQDKVRMLSNKIKFINAAKWTAAFAQDAESYKQLCLEYTELLNEYEEVYKQWQDSK